jgi:hypothetical protein
MSRVVFMIYNSAYIPVFKDQDLSNVRVSPEINVGKTKLGSEYAFYCKKLHSIEALPKMVTDDRNKNGCGRKRRTGH